MNKIQSKKVPSSFKKVLFLLGMVPGVLFGASKFKAPSQFKTNINNSRLGLHKGIKSFSYQDKLETASTTERLSQQDFIDFLVATLGETRINFNPEKGLYQTGAGPNGFTGNLWYIDMENQTMTESNVPSDIDDVPYSYNLVRDNQDRIVKIDMDTGNRTVLISEVEIVLNIKDIIEHDDGNYYAGDDYGNILKFDGTNFTVLHSLAPEEGIIKTVSKGLDENIYFLAFNSEYWMHSVFKYDANTGVTTKVFDQNFSNKIYTDLFADTEGSIFLGASDTEKHTVEKVENSDSTSILWSVSSEDTNNSPMTSFAGNQDEEGKLSFTMLFNSFNGGTVQVIKENQPPVIINHIGHQTLLEDADPAILDLSGLSDKPEDIKTLESISPTGILDISIEGNSMTCTPIANMHGSGTVTIAITNNFGQTTTTEFDFTVTAFNDNPEVSNPIQNQVMLTTDIPLAIDLSGVFLDVDSELTYCVSSGNEDIATAIISGDNLVVTPISEGSCTISVSADDDEGTPAQNDFTITINKREENINLTTLFGKLEENRNYSISAADLGFGNEFVPQNVPWNIFTDFGWQNDNLLIGTHASTEDFQGNIVLESTLERKILKVDVLNVEEILEPKTDVYLHQNTVINYPINGIVIQAIKDFTSQKNVNVEDITVTPILRFLNGNNPDDTIEYPLVINLNQDMAITINDDDVEAHGYTNGSEVLIEMEFQINLIGENESLGYIAQRIEGIDARDVSHSVAVPSSLSDRIAIFTIDHAENLEEINATLEVSGTTIPLEVSAKSATQSTIEFDAYQYIVGAVRIETSIGTIQEVSTTDFDFSVTGLESFEEEAFKVYPNPVKTGNTIKTEINLLLSGTVHISLHDLQGRKILNQVMENAGSGKHTFQIPTQKLTRSIYLLRIQVGDDVVRRKVEIR